MYSHFYLLSCSCLEGFSLNSFSVFLVKLKVRKKCIIKDEVIIKQQLIAETLITELSRVLEFPLERRTGPVFTAGGCWDGLFLPYLF